MKAVFITGKQYKKELLISHNEVRSLQAFLKNVIADDVLIINTNLGVEVYYFSPIDCTTVVTNSFLILLIKKNKDKQDYRISATNCNKEFLNETALFFSKTASMPLLFLSYSKSVCNQLDKTFLDNAKIIKNLFVLWQDALFLIHKKDEKSVKTKQLLASFQKLYVENNYSPMLKKLLKKVIHQIRYN